MYKQRLSLDEFGDHIYADLCKGNLGDYLTIHSPEGSVTLSYTNGTLTNIAYSLVPQYDDVYSARTYIRFLAEVEHYADSLYQLFQTQSDQRAHKLERFWNWINSLSETQYLRAQTLCQHFIGGWTRGIGFGKSGTFLVIESQNGQQEICIY